MISDLRRGKRTVTIHQNHGYMDDMLEIKDAPKMVQEGVCVVNVDKHHHLSLIVELRNETSEMHNCAMEIIDLLIIMRVDGTVLSSLRS